MQEDIARQICNLRKEISDIDRRRLIMAGDLCHKKKQLADLEKQVEKEVEM